MGNLVIFEFDTWQIGFTAELLDPFNASGRVSTLGLVKKDKVMLD